MYYLLLILPAVFAVIHSRFPKYIFSALVTLSCALTDVIFSEPIILAAYIFSVIGDYFMAHTSFGKNYFLYGICGFFAAHSAFLIYALSNAKLTVSLLSILKLVLILAMLAGYTIFLIRRIHPNIKNNPPMKIAVSMYTYISCAVFGVALFSKNAPIAALLFVLGVLLIIFSDTIIALRSFTGTKKYGSLICPAYHACHILIAASIIWGSGGTGNALF